jgi:hypothetical protein
MSIYLPKFFIAIQQIKDLIFIFITFTFSFLFSYSILTVIDFKFGSLSFKITKKDLEDEENDRNFTILKYGSWIFGAFI